MKVDITLKNVSIAIGITITVSGVLLGLLDMYISHKLSDVREWQTATGAKMDLLMEERMVLMERTELYNRFKRTLDRADEDNYSMDRYIDSDYEEKEARKK